MTKTSSRVLSTQVACRPACDDSAFTAAERAEVELVGAALATAALVRSRGVPSLAQVIASAEAEPVVAPPAGSRFTSGAGLRPRGEGKP